METEKNTPLGEDVKTYFRTNLKLAQLKAVDKISDAGSAMFAQSVTFSLLGVTFLFLSVGAAFYIAQLTNSFANGFFIVGGFYFLLFLILFIFRKSLMERPLKNKMVKSMLDEEI